MGVQARWRSSAALVAGFRDVIDARVLDGDAPDALVARGWDAFLASIDDAELEALEARGLEARWPARAPASLLALVERARAVCALPALGGDEAPTRRLRAGETPRKRAQIEPLVRIVAPLAARARRVVDVGAGHGHLTRAVADRLSVPVLGLEREPRFVDRARSLSQRASAGASFAVRDVLREGLAIEDGDCVLGLHACGELGDVAVETVARRASSLVLVGCCPQKRRDAVRSPLCRIDELGAALDFPRHLLGLANLAMRDEGVEASRAENLAARERRLALRSLLEAEGGVLRPGEEIEGLNRRAAHEPLATLVARAFERRGASSPSVRAIEAAHRWARARHALARRLSLPRALLGRALETWLALDRARRLEIEGWDVDVGTAFDGRASVRNVAIVAARG